MTPRPRRAPAANAAPGRADLVRALAHGDRAALEATAALLGFTYHPRKTPPREAKKGEERARRIPPPPKPEPEPAFEGFQPIPFWRVVRRETRGDREERAASTETRPRPIAPEDLTPPAVTPVRQTDPIVAWPRLWRALDDRLRSLIPRRAIDVRRLVGRWARGETVRRLPRCTGLAHARVALLLDRSERLQPFWGDQVAVAQALARRLGIRSLRLLPSSPQEGSALPAIAADEKVLVLGDLGFYDRPATRQRWERFGMALRRASGAALLALVPCPTHRWTGRAPRIWSAIDWSTPHGASRGPRGSALKGSGAEEAEPAADQVLRLASVAMRLEAGLLRQLRRLVPGADLGTEVEIWRHPAVVARQAVGLVLDAERARQWRREFRSLPPTLQQAVVAILERWHTAPEIWAAEIADLAGSGVRSGVVGEAALVRSQEVLGRIAALATRTDAGPRFAVDNDAWLGRLAGWGSQGSWHDERYRPLLAPAIAALQRRYQDMPLPVGVTSEMLADESADRPLRRFTLWHEAKGLRVRSPEEQGQGSPLAQMMAREPRLAVGDGLRSAVDIDLEVTEAQTAHAPGMGALELVTDVESVSLEIWETPPWASASGRDEHGLWAALEVEGVVQRMRWIAPGQFWMGSPESEAGRWRDEGPRHEVVLSKGFWLAETPCTQALWEAVMGKNPSHFRSPRRPVENVSWDDCQGFFARLNKRLLGLQAKLPTEAQWEYACRAETDMATWEGDLEILGERNAPLLDEIAWYGGNSGVDFDLEKNEDVSDWPDLPENPLSMAGTREVGLKRANPWGLYDMLGNVDEWCRDWKGDYESQTVVDPIGPSKGTSRVIRGGSWDDLARDVRAAFRDWFDPGYRCDSLGFRLSRGQGQ